MVALVGGKEPWRLDWQQVRRRCDHLRESNAVGDPVLRHESGLRLLHLGRWHADRQETQLVSLADPLLEYSAATVRLSRDAEQNYFYPAKWIRFCRSCRQTPADGPGGLPSAEMNLGTLANGLLELDYARRTRHQLADAIALRVAQTIPRCFQADRRADWDRWPGTPVFRANDSQN